MKVLDWFRYVNFGAINLDVVSLGGAFILILNLQACSATVEVFGLGLIWYGLLGIYRLYIDAVVACWFGW